MSVTLGILCQYQPLDPSEQSTQEWILPSYISLGRPNSQEQDLGTMGDVKRTQENEMELILKLRSCMGIHLWMNKPKRPWGWSLHIRFWKAGIRFWHLAKQENHRCGKRTSLNLILREKPSQWNAGGILPTSYLHRTCDIRFLTIWRCVTFS